MSLGVTIADFVEGCRSREGRLPFEIGAFVALEMCEFLLQQGPAIATAEESRISDEGQVAVYAPPHSATSADAARSVVDVLAHLLVASGTGVPPVLLTLVESGPADGHWDLARLRDELEASLVPLNRAAARRVLSRLLKETRSRRTAPVVPSADSIDADLDALLAGKDSVDMEAPTQRLQALDDLEVDAVLASLETSEDTDVSARAPDIDEPPTVKELRSVEVSHQEPEPTDILSRRPSLDGFEEVGEPRRGLGALIAVVALIGLAAGALFFFMPDVVDRIFGDAPPEEPEPTVEPAPEGRPRGLLEVQADEGAQILFLVGRGPAVAEDLPVGVAHEFVAIADGHSPTRAVVAADAMWGDEPTPRYELAMQSGEDTVAFDEIDLGETRLRRDAMGAPSGRLGDIRVITNPPGARVFLLIGFGSARIEDLPADESVQLLVFSEGHAPREITVGPSDWIGEGAQRVARLNVSFD